MEIPKLEKEIQREICEYLDSKKVFFWRSNNVPVFAKSNDGKKRFRALPKFTPKGLPDIMVVREGLVFGFEVKRVGGKIREEQRDFGIKFQLHGGMYALVYSVQDVIDVLSRYASLENPNIKSMM